METQTNDPFAAMVAAKNQDMPQTPWHSFWIWGEAGTYKTRLALGAARCAGPVAYVGSESGAEDYLGDPEFPGFDRSCMLEVRSAAEYRKATEAVISSGRYKTVIYDQMTDIYQWEMAEEEKVKDGKKYIPMQAWGRIKSEHKRYLRMLRDAPLHKIFISQQKEITVTVKGDDGMMKLETVGFKVDSEKKDSHAVKVVLRMTRKDGGFVAECWKDRLSRQSGFKQGDLIKNPKIEMWLGGGK